MTKKENEKQINMNRNTKQMRKMRKQKKHAITHRNIREQNDKT